MGLSLKFFAGNKNEIVDAIAKENFEFLEDLEDKMLFADFSLHITPNDLNHLVEIVSSTSGRVPLGLREQLDTEEFYFDEADRGAFFVQDVIKTVFAQCDLTLAGQLAHEWYERLKLEYPDEALASNKEAVTAIEDMIRISKKAIENDLDIVHVWFA